jgi:multiple antibiotic resistance protein
MIESFITAFIIYFVVIDPVGNAPVFLAVTTAQTRRQKFRTAIEATMFASFIMLFFCLVRGMGAGLSEGYPASL